MQYKDVEAVLAKVFQVSKEKMGAFRARLRHLRTLGVPGVAKPGSGERVDYTREHILHIAVALQLELGGVSPSYAAGMSDLVLRSALKRLPRRVTHDIDDFVYLVPGNPFGHPRGRGPEPNIVSGGPQGLTLEKVTRTISDCPSITIINVGRLFQWVDTSIEDREGA